MNEQINREAAQFLSALMTGKLSRDISSLAIDSLSKTESALMQINSASKDGLKTLEDVTLAACQSGKSLGEKILSNAEGHARAAIEATRAIINSENLSEAMSIQTSYVQKQAETAGVQAQELFEFSSRAAQGNFASVSSAFLAGAANLKLA